MTLQVKSIYNHHLNDDQLDSIMFKIFKRIGNLINLETENDILSKIWYRPYSTYIVLFETLKTVPVTC